MTGEPRPPALRSTRRLRIWGALSCALYLASCMSLSGHAERLAEPETATDRFQIERGSLLSAHGCRFDYRVYEPVQPSISDTVVVMGHGFLRHQNTMIQMARKLANAGYRTATLNFCNMKPWNGHHQANATDMRLLADQLGSPQRIYAGHSAGALAAVLAAANDTRTLGLITLDLVDQHELARNALATISLPVIALHGEPSSCNAHSEAVDILAEGPTVSVSRIANANHCAFESPTNWLCTWVCGSADMTAQRLDIQDRVTDAVIRLVMGKGHVDTTVTHN